MKPIIPLALTATDNTPLFDDNQILKDLWLKVCNAAHNLIIYFPIEETLIIGSERLIVPSHLRSDQSFLQNAQNIQKALTDFENALPDHALARDGKQVWECMEFCNRFPGDKFGYLEMNNARGECENITTFLPERSSFKSSLDWFISKSQSYPGMSDQSDWDLWNAKRNVVDYYGFRSLIDPGVNLPLDLMEKIGIETYASCEGHPNGAYFAWRSGDFQDSKLEYKVAEVFKNIKSWKVEIASDKSIVVRMNEVFSIPQRDNIWRSTCQGLQNLLDAKLINSTIESGNSESVSLTLK